MTKLLTAEHRSIAPLENIQGVVAFLSLRIESVVPSVFSCLGVLGITPVMFSRDQLKRAATLTEEDHVQLGRCRRPHNRLGFAYQVAFLRLFDRFLQQQPFELFEELVCFSAARLA